MLVTFYLHVRTDDATTAWYKQVETDCIPLSNIDEVILWPREDDAGGGPAWHVIRRYMHSDGTWHVVLGTMVVDPQAITLDMGEKSWSTEVDGDPTPKLGRGGWVKFD